MRHLGACRIFGCQQHVKVSAENPVRYVITGAYVPFEFCCDFLLVNLIRGFPAALGFGSLAWELKIFEDTAGMIQELYDYVGLYAHI